MKLFESIKEKLTESSNPVEMKNSNLLLYGLGKDGNGNSVVSVGFPNQRAFSIQANVEQLRDTLGILRVVKKVQMLTGDQKAKIEKELVDFIKNYGSPAQKKLLKTYSGLKETKLTESAATNKFSAEVKNFEKQIREDYDKKKAKLAAMQSFSGVFDKLEQELKQYADSNGFDFGLNIHGFADGVFWAQFQFVSKTNVSDESVDFIRDVLVNRIWVSRNIKIEVWKNSARQIRATVSFS